MRIVSTNIHGLFDYLLGVYLITLPWLFGYAVIGGPATWIPVVLGVWLIAYSLLTDYEWGLVKSIPVRGHLILDLVVGATLFLSIPFFGFFDTTAWIPHTAAAVLIVAGGLFTRQEPEADRPFIPHREKLLPP